MLRSLLPRLRCPVCGQGLSIPTGADPVEEGELTCGAGHVYPIRRGVARFSSDAYAASFGYQWNRFSRTQLDSASGTAQSRDAFVTKTGLALSDLRGKSVLEVGCGMGRFLEVVADAGGDVIGFDLSSAVDAAYRNVGQRKNVHILQADVFRPPLAPESFDDIYSLGVLHHTPDPRAAFLGLVRLLKPGGRISIWVYDRHSGFLISSLLRMVTTRLPRPWLLRLCEVARPWGSFLLKVRSRRLQYLLLHAAPVSLHPDPEWRVLDTFDWYSPRYQYKYGWAEVREWFAEAGLTEVRELEFPIAITARKP